MERPARSALPPDPPVVFRQAVVADLVEAAQIYQSAAMALNDRLRSKNPWASKDARAIDLREAIRALSTLSAHRPEGVIVAETANELAGVAAVRIRGRHAHIAFLFVLPEWQGKGIGTQLLDKIGEIIAEAGASIVTLIASRDPRAWQRYLRFGLRPGPPVMSLRAPKPRFPDTAPEDKLTALAVGLDQPEVLKAIVELDRDIGGVSREGEIAAWLEDGTQGALLVEPTDGQPCGFFLVSLQADHGRIGPIAARTVERLPVVLTRALHRAGTLPGAHDRTWRVDLPSVNQVAIAPLLDAGFFPQNLMPWFATGEIGQWDRYIFRDDDQL